VVRAAQWGMDLLRRWAATAAIGRAAVILAATLLVASAVILNAAEHTSPGHRTRTVAGPSSAPAVTTDATGCPVTVHCEIRGSAPPALRAALRRAFPHAMVQSAETTLDPAGGRVYRASILARADADDTVSLASQCIPHAAMVGTQTLNGAQSHVDLAGNSIIDLRITTTIVPGGLGCSVSVELRSATGRQASAAAARGLAHDPTTQLTA
jgi:hypothetical protein